MGKAKHIKAMSLLRNVPEHPYLSIALHIPTSYIVLFSLADRSDQWPDADTIVRT
jgi:hypothetical protein